MIKRFFNKLFPPELVAYVPGQKFLAGLITAGGLAVAAALTSANIDTSVIGIPINEGTITTVAGLAAVYLWPETEDSTIESELAAVDEPLGVDPGDQLLGHERVGEDSVR